MIYDQNVSAGIRSTIDYIRGPGHDNVPGRADLLGGQGFFDLKTEADVKLAVDLMERNARPEMQASQTKKCEKDALHISLSWARGQRADQDEMLEAGRAFLKELGMKDAMALFYRHSDKQHPHMHLGASMIDPKTGLTYDRYQFVYRGQHQAIKWEREKDQITPSRRHQHDIADAAGGVPDFDRLQNLLRRDDGKISHKAIDHALALGGHFGPDMAAHRVAFKEYIKAEPERTREQSKEQEQVDWAERLGLKTKTPEQLRGLIDMTKQQSARFEQTINDPIDSKRHDQETLKHYAEQVRTGREGITAAEQELARRGISPEPERIREQISSGPRDSVYPLQRPMNVQADAVRYIAKEQARIDLKGITAAEHLERRGISVEPERTRELEKERLRADRHARLPPIDSNDRWWMEPIESKQTVKIAARWDASGPQHDEPTPMIERLSKAQADGPKPIGPEPTPERIGIPSKTEQARPAMTDDELAIEHKTLAAVAFKDGDTITKDELNDLIKTGGRLGPDTDVAREKFLKSQGPQLKKSPDGPEQDRWWMEPAEAGPARKPLMVSGNQDSSKDKQLLRDGKRDADSEEDVKRRQFVERMERSHEQFGKLTPSMRVALGQEPERPKPVKEIDLDAKERAKTSETERFNPSPSPPKQIEHQPKTQLEKTEQAKPVKDIDLDAHQFRRVRDREPAPSYYKQFGDAVRDRWHRGNDKPEPTPKYPERPVPMGRDMRDDNYDEPQQRIQRIREMSGEGSTQRGSPEKGNLEDRTDQTAEGRRYLKQQRSRGRGR